MIHMSTPQQPINQPGHPAQSVQTTTQQVKPNAPTVSTPVQGSSVRPQQGPAQTVQTPVQPAAQAVPPKVDTPSASGDNTKPVEKPSVPHTDPEFKPVDVDPTDKVPPATEDLLIDLSAVIEEHRKNVAQRRADVRNLDKFPLDIPLDKIQDINRTRLQELARDRDLADDKMSDVASDYSSMERCLNYFSENLDMMARAISHIREPLNEVLKHTRGGVGDADATLSSRFKGKARVELSEVDSYMTMATMTGGMRRITLWNSGIHVTLRKIPLNVLNEYYKLINEKDYEYGKEFGGFYYNFADLAIKEYMIESLLPIAICTSNYAHWRNTDKLLQAISIQDFDTLVWGMACMLHPRGTSVNFTCGKPNCGHVHRIKSDLTKLRLLNTDLINDEMINHFRKSGPVTDEDLQRYKQALNLKKTLSFNINPEGDQDELWKFNLKQISLADHLDIGRDFNAELRRAVHVDNRTEVTDYTIYNLYRTFKPWLESVECTIHHDDGQDQTLVWNNTGTEESDKSMYLALDTISNEVDDFEKQMQDYIVDSRISHIAFYMPKCPKCGGVPSIGYHGYIPYDAMRNFFTLVLMKLLRRVSARNRTNSSPDTTE